MACSVGEMLRDMDVDRDLPHDLTFSFEQFGSHFRISNSTM